MLTSGGGLWKTKNLFDPSGFPTWTPLSDNLLSTCGGSFALGRSSDTIYLGLGDPILYFGTRNAPGCIGGMMYISQDGGLTWGLPSYFTFEVEGAVYTATIIFDVQVEHSQSPDVVLVSTEIGIFRSIDGGASFSHVYPTRNVTNIVLGRQTPTFSLAQSLVRTSVGWMSFDYLPSVRQLILSENGGQNWSTPVESNWGLVTGSDSGVALGRTTLAVGTPGENVVYAVVGLVNAPNPSLTSRATEQLNVFKSTDGGILWESLRCNSSYTPTNPVASTFQYFIISI